MYYYVDRPYSSYQYSHHPHSIQQSQPMSAQLLASGQVKKFVGFYVDMMTNHGNYCNVMINSVNDISGNPDFGAVTFTQYVNGMPQQLNTHINNINNIGQAGSICTPGSSGGGSGGSTYPGSSGGGTYPGIPHYCKHYGWWHYPECHKYHI